MCRLCSTADTLNATTQTQVGVDSEEAAQAVAGGLLATSLNPTSSSSSLLLSSLEFSDTKVYEP